MPIAGYGWQVCHVVRGTSSADNNVKAMNVASFTVQQWPPGGYAFTKA